MADSFGGLNAGIESAEVAQLYYLEGKTKSEIATRLGISRFRVARVLEKCLSEGLVKVVFDFPMGEIDYELSGKLKRAFSLKHAVVVNESNLSGTSIMSSLARAAATLLDEICDENDVIGLASTQAIETMSSFISKLPAAMVVQLCGAYPGAGTGPTAIDLVRDVARLIDGPALMYHAPLITSDLQAAEAIRRQPDVLAAKGAHARITKAVVGVGAWAEGRSSVWGAVDDEVREDVSTSGAVGEICGGIYFDASGQVLQTRATSLAIGISGEELLRIPEIIGVVFGLERTGAVRAALRGKLVKSVVTHSALANALLEG